MTRRPSARSLARTTSVPKIDAGRSRADWIVVALVVLFFVELASGAIGPKSEFLPADGVMSVCALVALAHAAALTWALEVARRRRGGSLGGPKPLDSLGAVLFVGVLMFVVTWMIDSFMICGQLNRLFGARTVQSATVEARTQPGGRGCHFEFYVFGDTVPSGTSLCADEATWQRVRVGDHLPVVVVDGRFGQSVAIDPDALKGTP